MICLKWKWKIDIAAMDDDAIYLQSFASQTSTLLIENIVDWTSRDVNKINNNCGASDYNFTYTIIY